MAGVYSGAMARRTRQYWLMKTEPDAYSIGQLQRETRAPWDGIRNYRARNFMRDQMGVGDLVLFYHSSTKIPGVAGVARVASEAYPDPTQFDTESKYFDAKSTADRPRWELVDVEYVETLAELVPLSQLREDPELDGMWLLKKGMRLSIQPVEKAHFARILKRGRAKTRVR
jgi:predicted RNA-binding protein with PUA-like domain